MTHTHHRRGTRASLSKDYVMITRVALNIKEQTLYRGALKGRVEQFLTICARHNPIGIATKDKATNRVVRWMKWWDESKDSGIHRCSKIHRVTDEPNPVPRAETHIIFSTKKDLLEAVKEVKEADLGLSVVVSGVFDEVFEVCKLVGTGPHTVNLSLGTWGKRELLPPEPILSLVTMCGHSMISRHLIDDLMDKINKEKMTPEEAAVELGKQCTCNIFNVERGAHILREHLSRK